MSSLTVLYYYFPLSRCGLLLGIRHSIHGLTSPILCSACLPLDLFIRGLAGQREEKLKLSLLLVIISDRFSKGVENYS